MSWAGSQQNKITYLFFFLFVKSEQYIFNLKAKIIFFLLITLNYNMYGDKINS